jgi:hypothetical protein
LLPPPRPVTYEASAVTDLLLRFDVPSQFPTALAEEAASLEKAVATGWELDAEDVIEYALRG